MDTKAFPEKSPPRYLIPDGHAQIIQHVKGSRFIARGTHIETYQQAEEWIQTLRTNFPDASHHCPAFRIKNDYNTILEWSSDDGEPRGTAGKPILSAIQTQNVKDVVIVVTRYFGGTKLGTGGLVRAYGGAARELLKIMPTKLKIPLTKRQLVVEYHEFENTKSFFEHFEIEIIEERFEKKVTFTFHIPSDRIDEFNLELREFSNGKLRTDTL